jgi:pilus assembly protein CpaC
MKNILLKSALALLLLFQPLGAFAQIVGPPGSISLDPHGKGAVNRRLSIAEGKSVAIDLPREAKDIMIANPAIANATVRSATKIFVIGVKIGQTNIHVLDADGRQIIGFDVEVGRDLVALKSTLRQLIPDSPIQAEAIGDSVILTGSVASPLDAQRAMDLAGRIVGDPLKVVNALSIRGKDQVHLKVTVAEIQRTALKQLGVNFGLSPTGQNGTFVNSLNGFAATGTSPASSLVTNLILGKTNIAASVKWMESNALLRTLAEPTLTAISGESAKFLAGGEFPVPTGRDRDGNITMEFKTFGVSLVFTPVVLSEGRISMKIGTEVSEISAENSINMGTIVVPGLKVRRADSTVELPSGGTMVMAGLIQEGSKQAIERLPGLGNIPVIGALFRSREFQRSQTELVIMVTPYIVNPVSANALAKPTDGFEEADDASGFLLGRFNKVYGKQHTAGPVGHLRD